jgi:predicted DNA-binding protein YlxM (UPF0122 family)
MSTSNALKLLKQAENPTKREPNKVTRKIDVALALDMRLRKGMTFQAIADYFGVNKGSVFQSLKRFLHVIQSPEAVQAFNKSKSQVLDAVELELLSQLVNTNKLKDASTNNIAYALKEVHNMNRLEKDLSTSNISQGIKVMVVGHDGEPFNPEAHGEDNPKDNADTAK